MTVVLKGLTIREHRSFIVRSFIDQAEPGPVFRDEEIAFLVIQLIEGLKRATPEEYVTFYISTLANSVKLEVTSGAIYVRGADLHFILSNHWAIYGIPSYGMVYDRRHPTYSLVPRGFSLSFDQPKLLVPQQVSFDETPLGDAKDNEVVIDLEKLTTEKIDY